MKKKIIIIAIIVLFFILIINRLKNNKKEENNVITENVIIETNMIINNIEPENKNEYYKMSETEIINLSTNVIQERTIEDEKQIEQEVENESFEEQGEIAYEGTKEFPTVNLGKYNGLTYYSQIDLRCSKKSYTSTNNSNQTIGSSGCGPAVASMVVTAIKGTITPDKMADIFIKYGYRSANNGTYWSAFRFIADTFNIDYNETSITEEAIDLLKNNNYVIASCGNGLFTIGGHFVLITGINGDTLSIYDPYLYSGKFETSTRRGKVTVSGNTIYCSIDNFKKYANAKRFFSYKHNANITTNSTNVTTSAYTRYVKVRTSLNVRTNPNGKIIGSLYNSNEVKVYETKDGWSKIGDNKWVWSEYLVENKTGENVKNTNDYVLGLYRVNASALNVRIGPSTNYKIKRVYKNNTRFDTYEIKGKWARTPSGWVCLDYCKLIRKY